jgi:hypothetical protein
VHNHTPSSSRGRHSAQASSHATHRAATHRGDARRGRLGLPLSVALTALTAALLLAVAVMSGAPTSTSQSVASGDALTDAGHHLTWKQRKARAAARAARQANAAAPASTSAASPSTTATAPTGSTTAPTGSTSTSGSTTNGSTGSTAKPGGTAGLLYSADSFFRSRVTNAPVDAARTASFRAFMASNPDQAGITWPKINMNPDWAMSYHVGTATDPVWRLAGGNTSDPHLTILRTQGFHMADAVADTFPTGAQDRPGVMVDMVFGYTVQFADAVPNKATRTITVSNAGIMWHGSNGLDGRNPASNDKRNFTSRGRIPDAMVIRRDLLDQAIAHGTGLGHVLHLFFVETNSADGVASPMTGAEGGQSGWGAEGERIRIRPDIDLAARGLTGAALAIARTLQENGAYIGDNSGSSTQIKASQPSVYTGTNLTTDALKGKISWADFEVLPRGWKG